MSAANEELPGDHAARERFRNEWQRNFAVSANAGSGKTTAISERLAVIALAPEGADILKKTAVVTFTKKAAAQIGQRARNVLMRRLAKEGRRDLAPLDHLERAFFGTIHSFCLLLAQRYGQTLGINLNPTVVAETDEGLWEEFLEQDVMEFSALAPAQVDAFLRHAPLDAIFDLARRLDVTQARRFLKKTLVPQPPEPDAAVLQEILGASSKGKGALALKRNQEAAVEWRRRFHAEKSHLPIPKPDGSAAGIKELFPRYFAPVKHWLAEAGAVLAAELALRYRAWRFERGVQTYADQIEAALAVLQDERTLEAIRAEGWRVVLDEAQDTDPHQFAVLVEITRPPRAPIGTWPGVEPGPRAGHFCMVGDGQQAIYGSRADIRNFQRHIAAFAKGSGGELLTFEVTFRAPHRVIALLNTTLDAAFGAVREHNIGLPPAEGADAPLLQVVYERLAAGPKNLEGAVGVLPLSGGEGRMKVEVQLAAEVRQIAASLKAGGPASVGAKTWGDICILAPRNEWLVTARKELEAAGLTTALQMRRNRNGDNPVYAWLCGLLAAACDPDNTFEWVGVLRELFTVSDAQIAAALRDEKIFHWDDAERYDEPLRGALVTLRPFVERVDAEGEPLERFVTDLARACGLAGKARAIDPSGALTGELERLVARAAEAGLEGIGARAWLRELLLAIDEGRPAGKPSADTINLLTSHSAKGLEWPVVIPIGLWRAIGKPPEAGLRLVADPGGETRVFFDGDSMPEATRTARERERLRELVRLLYVTLTRPRNALVLPWGATFAKPAEGCFLHLWGADLAQTAPIVFDAPPAPAPSVGVAPEPAVTSPTSVEQLTFGLEAEPKPPFPARLLPHELAHAIDLPRTARHESGADVLPPVRAGEDPIEYGLWWHEAMEFMPWGRDDAVIATHRERALQAAGAKGFRPRGEEEWARLTTSAAWREMHDARWRRQAELGVFAPLEGQGWIDGVIDLVLHDPATNELRIVDWKTNRRRSGETDDVLLTRLVLEYTPQLKAYATCAGGFFPGARVQALVFSTAAGAWQPVSAG